MQESSYLATLAVNLAFSMNTNNKLSKTLDFFLLYLAQETQYLCIEEPE